MQLPNPNYAHEQVYLKKYKMTKDIKICKCLAIICLVIRLLLNDTTKCHNIILDIDKLVRAMTFELDLTDIVPQRPCRLTTLLTLTLSSTMSIILIKWIRLANSKVSDILLLSTVLELSALPATVLLLPVNSGVAWAAAHDLDMLPHDASMMRTSDNTRNMLFTETTETTSI